jgi:hypothetical protein
VRATLQAIIAAPKEFPNNVGPRLGLYRTFHAIWDSAGKELAEDQDGATTPALRPFRRYRARPCCSARWRGLRTMRSPI